MKNGNNPPEDKKEYTIPINDKIRTALARYFTSFQKFIETSKGKKIGFELANFNGTLILTVYTDSDDDIKEMDRWVNEYLEQMYNFIKTGSIGDLIIDKDNYPISEYDTKLTMVEQKSRIRSLESDLEFAHLTIEEKKII